jgi:glycosyltransferase involved in cell wall biosynthesis
MKKKRIIASVTTDLVTDQRVHKISQSLHQAGYEVWVVGRQKKDSLPMPPRAYHYHRMKLFFEKGAFFYIEFHIRLFFYLLFHPKDIFIANDLDTLLPNYLISKLYRKQLAYDNHEYFTSVPELIARPHIQKIWKTIERSIFPKVKYIYTDNYAKRKLFVEEYKVPVEVVMNVPIYNPELQLNNRYLLPQLKDKFVIIYQGTGINVERGTEELTEAMRYLDDRFLLMFVGSGDVIHHLKEIVKRYELENKVLFVGKVPQHELVQYTLQAHLGATLDKPISDNYIYSMPNKLFDYVHAGVPVLASRLPEVERMMDTYQIGTFIESHDPKHIAGVIEAVYNNPSVYQQWKENTKAASKAVNWKTSEEMLLKIFNGIQ